MYLWTVWLDGGVCQVHYSWTDEIRTFPDLDLAIAHMNAARF
jgi:hypothetical protein